MFCKDKCANTDKNICCFHCNEKCDVEARCEFEPKTCGKYNTKRIEDVSIKKKVKESFENKTVLNITFDDVDRNEATLHFTDGSSLTFIPTTDNDVNKLAIEAKTMIHFNGKL